MDVAFYEPFSGLHHRIVAAGAFGLSDDACVVTVVQTAGAGVPATVVVGDEERISCADVLDRRARRPLVKARTCATTAPRTPS